MSGKVDRPDIDTTLGNIAERVRTLEAVVPPVGGSGGDIFCLNCFAVDEDLAGCVDIRPGPAVAVPHQMLVFNPGDPSPITSGAPVFEVLRYDLGHYQCNYAAGFRVSMSYGGKLKQAQLSFGVARGATPPTAGQWSQAPTPPGLTTYENVATGSVIIDYDPAGDGDPEDVWFGYLGYTNGSFLVDGEIQGKFSAQYISGDAIYNGTPQPQLEGQILVAIPVGLGNEVFKWVTLDPGAVGTVLTINGTGVPEWM